MNFFELTTFTSGFTESWFNKENLSIFLHSKNFVHSLTQAKVRKKKTTLTAVLFQPAGLFPALDLKLREVKNEGGTSLTQTLHRRPSGDALLIGIISEWAKPGVTMNSRGNRLWHGPRFIFIFFIFFFTSTLTGGAMNLTNCNQRGRRKMKQTAVYLAGSMTVPLEPSAPLHQYNSSVSLPLEGKNATQ